MPRIPASLVPRSVVFLRRRPFRVLKSGTPVWRAIAFVFITRQYSKRFFGKSPEHLTTERVLIGQSMTVSAIQPTRRCDARRARKAKAAGTAS